MSNSVEAKDKIDKLSQILEEHRIAYHVKDKPTVSDAEYDALMKELIMLENKYPEYMWESSPSKRIGGEVIESFGKVAHKYRQWSFDNVFDLEELKEWESRNNKILKKNNINSNSTYVCELKIDGLKVVLSYEGGELVRAATRGDGKIGEDVTHNIKTIKSIPLRLSTRIDITVMGECYITKTELQNINNELISRGEEVYANTRNLAAGTIRQLDSKVAAKRKLKIFAYDIEYDINDISLKSKFKDQESELEFLSDQGFLVNSEYAKVNSIDDVQNYYESWENSRDDMDYGIDGVVIKINEREVFEALGYTAKSPRGGIAYKFKAEEATTVIENVIYQVGRTGAITPVAEVRPTEVYGSTISRVTLHNEDEIIRLGISIGDTVIIRKAGDVIPEIVKALPKLRSGREVQIEFPKACPSCNSKLEKMRIGKDLGVKLYCKNTNCNAQRIEKYIHFVSKKGMNIEGLGDKIIEEFLSLGIINSFASVYNLKEEDINMREGYGDKSASNIINSIKRSSQVKLQSLIYSLGIHQIGEVGSEELAKHFGSIEAIARASYEELIQVKDFGEVMANNVLEYFKNEANRSELLALLENINIISTNLESRILADKSFVITGTLEHERSYYENIIKSNGGTISSSVSKRTDYLLAGVDAGSKLARAGELGIKIINGEELEKLLS